MPSVNVALSHIETCHPCYMQDHYNREGELALYSPVTSKTTNKDIMEDILFEFQNSYLEDLSEDEFDMLHEAFRSELSNFFKNKEMDTAFDNALIPCAEEEEEGYEPPMALFLVTYEVA